MSLCAVFTSILHKVTLADEVCAVLGCILHKQWELVILCVGFAYLIVHLRKIIGKNEIAYIYIGVHVGGRVCFKWGEGCSAGGGGSVSFLYRGEL